MEQWTALKLGKEYVKDVYYQPAYLTYIQSTLCEIPGWMKSQVEINIAGRNCNKLKQTDATTLMAEREEELQNLLTKVLEKTLENPLDGKEIRPVDSKGNQP